MKKTNKLIASIAAALMVTASVPTLTNAATYYPTCTVANCNKLTSHKHNGTWYCGHTVNDGHSYHNVCTVSGCTKTKNHRHNGSSYMGHHNGDGHSHGSSHNGRGHH